VAGRGLGQEDWVYAWVTKSHRLLYKLDRLQGWCCQATLRQLVSNFIALLAQEERELQAYYDRMKAQKDEEARAAREQAREVEAAAAAAAHQVVPARADAGGKPRRVAKQLIDADWLDKPQQGGLPGAGLRQPGVQQGPGALAAEASQGSVGAGPTVYGQQHQPRVTHESSASELHPGLRRLGGPQPHAWSPPQQQADTKQPYAPGEAGDSICTTTIDPQSEAGSSPCLMLAALTHTVTSTQSILFALSCCCRARQQPTWAWECWSSSVPGWYL
jgi:hypothetical protein